MPQIAPPLSPGPAHREIGNFIFSANGTDLEVFWSQPEERPLGYHVAWARADEDYEDIGSPNGHAYPTDRQYSITGLESGVTYKVRVRAQYADDYGPWQDELTFTYREDETIVAATHEAVLSPTATASQPPPTAPQNLRAQVQGNGILLTWDVVDATAGYIIMRRDPLGGGDIERCRGR